MSAPLRLLDVPRCGFYPLEMAWANRLLVEWQHKLGPVHRPFHQEAWCVEVDGEPVSVATSGSIVNGPVGNYSRSELAELTRLCSAPGFAWVTRVMIRLWREVGAPAWPCWTVRAAVSYSQNAHYRGNIYRLDGWTRWAENCGSRGGGHWRRPRQEGDPSLGSKTLWGWRYEERG